MFAVDYQGDMQYWALSTSVMYTTGLQSAVPSIAKTQLVN